MIKKTILTVLLATFCLAQAIPSFAAGKRTSTDTGSGNISYALKPAVVWQVEEVRLHLSAAGGANDFAITLDAGAGAAYNAVLLTEDMTTVTDLIWRPDRPVVLKATDELEFTWTNGSGRTFGLEVVWSTTN